MKFLLVVLCALVALASAARLPFKAFIVSYPDETKWDVVSQAIGAVRNAGGKITHEYKIFKGFSCRVPPKIIETIKALGTEHGVTIEEDNMVSINGR